MKMLFSVSLNFYCEPESKFQKEWYTDTDMSLNSFQRANMLSPHFSDLLTEFTSMLYMNVLSFGR